MESSLSSGGGFPFERSPPYDGTNGDGFTQRAPSQEEGSIEHEGQEQDHQWTGPPPPPSQPPPPPRPASRQYLQQPILPPSPSASTFIPASGAQQQQWPPSHTSPAGAEDADVLLLLEEREVLREQLRQQIAEKGELERQHRADKERLAVVEEALDESTRMYKHAKEAAQQCSNDATEAMAELRTSQILREQLHTSLETALGELERLYAGMHSDSGLLQSDGRAMGLAQEQQQQADTHLPLDDNTAYDLTYAQRRASVIIHMLELLHERFAVTVTFRRAFALRIFFAFWRERFPSLFSEIEVGEEGEEIEYGAEGVLVAAGGARGRARCMINNCVSLVEDILHHPEERHQDQQQQQQQQYRPPQTPQQLRFRSSTLRPTLSLRGGERESPAPSFVSAPSSLADRGRERLLRKEVADLQAEVQSREEVQNVLLDILASYERKNLDLNFADSGEEVWWEEGSVSGGRKGEEGAGDDFTTIFSGGRSSSRGAGGKGRGREGRGVGEGAGGGAHLIWRVENFCRVVQQALEERKAWTEHMERSLVNCVCQSR